MKTALFIGRFQPFHTGHYTVLEDLVNDGVQHCVVGIGISQNQRTGENPLSYDERCWCIQTIMTAHPLPLQLSYSAIPDINDDSAWVAHLNKIVYSVAPRYTFAVTGNTLVSRLFTEAGVSVRNVKITIAITGTQIRAWMRKRDERWRSYVDPLIAERVASIVQTIHDQQSHHNAS